MARLDTDCSPRAGGVTSSSLEVLAGLALSTEEYVELMIFKDGTPSAFYTSYVHDIQAKIAENTAAEFQCIWHERTPAHAALGRALDVAQHAAGGARGLGPV